MSDTPRTDAVSEKYSEIFYIDEPAELEAVYELARTLERELTEAKRLYEEALRNLA